LKITYIRQFRVAFSLIALLILLVSLAYGTEDCPAGVRIVRNDAWNGFVSQIKFLPDDSPQDSFDKELLVIQKFLKAYETEVSVGVYDLEVFKAIDHARARFTEGRQRSGNTLKRAVLQGRASKGGEVTCGIRDSHRLQQM